MNKNGNIALIGANIIPMTGYDRFEAILAINGKVKMLGNDEEIKKAASSFGIVPINARGATILPGLHDCHAHLALTGHDLQGIDLYKSRSIAEVISLLKEADASLQSDRWLFGQRLDEALLEEKRPPTMEELNIFQRPIFISDRGGHYVIVNGKAYDSLGIDPKTMSGVRFGDDGLPNGRLQEKANKEARNRFPRTEEENWEAMLATMNLALSKGVTTIHCMEGFTLDDPSVPLLIKHQKDWPIDLIIHWCVANSHEEPLCRELGIWGGDILLDGSIGSRTAAFSTPYADADSCGNLYYTDEQVYHFVEGAVMRELVVSFHVIGECGIRQALNAMEQVLIAHPDKRDTARLRLEHFGFPSSEDIKRCAKLGVKVSTQPAFSYLRGGPSSVYRTRLGEKREKAGYPLRRMLDAGIIIGGGSDSDITPLDPLLGIHAAVNPPYPENSVTPYEALKMYTIDAAKTGWQDDIKGSLEAGKQADMTVLDDDPLTTDRSKIKDIKVLKTIRLGNIVFDAEKKQI